MPFTPQQNAIRVAKTIIPRQPEDCELIPEMIENGCQPDTELKRHRYLNSLNFILENEYYGNDNDMFKLIRFVKNTPLKGQTYEEKRRLDKRRYIRKKRYGD
jgi:hypothetical protein